MHEREDVHGHFSERAREWLALAYGEGDSPRSYPLGGQRVRLALAAIRERLGSGRGHVVDLGCGGGDLCAHAALLGFRVTGVDAATGMLTEARGRLDALPAAGRDRVTLKHADAVANGLADGCADAVAALGLLEYLTEDAPFFREAARLLRPGGALVVSCRNRLFNMVSANEYTRAEVADGRAAELLEELAALRPGPEELRCFGEFSRRLQEALAGFEEALARDGREAETPRAEADGSGRFAGRRRQHTPREIVRVASAAGFTAPTVHGVHPHFGPSVLETVAPRAYNRLCRALEAFESRPASLAWSSSFLVALTR